MPWIEADFGMNADTAGNYMRVATEFGNHQRVGDLTYRALTLFISFCA
jgi:hypothetical protein